MKQLLNSLLKKETAPALHNRLSWLSDLPKLNELDALKLSINHVTAILNDSTLTLNDKIDLILKIDDANYFSVHHQMQTFAKADNLKDDIASKIIDTNYAYHRIVFLAYTKIISLSFNQTPQLQPDNQTKLILLGRTLSVAYRMLKWRYFEHAPAPANLWSQAISLYKHANQDVLLKQKFHPYAAEPETTITGLFLQLMILGDINYTCLLKAQLNTITELIPNWAKDIRSKNVQETYHLFYIDLNKDQCAKRIRKSKPIEDCLFWDLDEVEYEITTAISALENHQDTPYLSMISNQNPQLLKETFGFLKKEWCRHGYVRERRKSPRKSSDNTVSVSLGFTHTIDLLREHIKPTNLSRSLLDGMLNDRRLSTSVVMRGNTNTLILGKEKWGVLDQSPSGISSLITVEKNLSLKPNKLCAILNHLSSAIPSIGVIKNIKQMNAGRLKVGIEIYTDNPNMVVLKKFDMRKEKTKDADENSIFAITNKEFLAIFLPQVELSNKAASLIIPKIEFMPNNFYEITFNKKREIIKLDEAIEYGDDWVMVSFPEELQSA